MEFGAAEALVFRGKSANSHIFHNRDGFYYHLREVRSNRARLQCRSYSRGCHGTARIDLNTGLLHRLQGHTHAPDFLLEEDMELRRQMVTDASTNTFGNSIRQILNHHKLSCRNVELAGRFTIARMHSSLYNARCSNYPPIPNSLLHLGVLLGVPNMHAICRTVDGADTIFRGVVGCDAGGTTSVVFISGRMLQFLQQCVSLHADGTFKKRPRKPKCSQIFNITTRFGLTVVCIMRVLMKRRNGEAYVTLFNYIKTIAPNLNLSTIHCDFERAQMNAWKVVFPPPCVIVGCLWHYAVAFSTHARSKLGLGQLAAENGVIYSFIKCMCGIPLLPKHLMWQGALDIWTEIEAAGWADTLRPLFRYFQREWMPRLNELSVYNEPERTNNCSETDNRMMANCVPSNHPNIWTLIGGFVQMEYLSWTDKLAVLDGGAVNGNRRWKAVLNDARIARWSFLLEMGQISPGEFLHRAAWSILAAVNYGLRIGENNDGESDSENDSEAESEDADDPEEG